MAVNPSQLLNTFQAVATIVSRLTPLIEHVPDSLGRWVPPIKAAVKANETLNAKLALGAGAAKALRGRFGAVDAVMAGLNLRTVGASRKMSALGALGAAALSKVVRGMRDSRREAQALAAQTGAVETKMQRLHRTSSKGGGGGGIGKVIAAVGGYRLLRVALDGFKGAFDLGGMLSDQAAKTGIAADQMLILRQAGKDAGIEDVSGAVNKMQDALVGAVTQGAGPAAKALGVLGLKAEELVKKSPVDQISAIGEELRKIKSPELRTAISRDIFGKAGTDLLPLLDNADALNEAQKALGSQATILRDNAAKFDAVSDRMGRAGLKLQGFFVGLAVTVLPLMEAATARLDALDLAGQGQRFGEGVKVAVNFLAGAFADPGALFDTALAYLKAGMLGAGNLLIAGVRVAGMLLANPAFLNPLATAFASAGLILQGALMKAFSAGSAFFSATMEAAVEKILSLLPEALGGKKSKAADAKAKIDNLQEANRAMILRMGEARRGEGPHAGKSPEMRAAYIASTRAVVDANNKEIEGLRKQASGPSIAERAAEIRGSEPMWAAIEEAANAKIAEGRGAIGAALEGVFDATAAVLKKIEVADVLGAGAALAAANRKGAAVAATGAAAVAGFIGPVAPPAIAGKRNPFAQFSSASTRSSLDFGRLVGATFGQSLFSANGDRFNAGRVADLSRAGVRRGPILSAAERRAFGDQRVAAGGERAASTQGAFAAVRAGDAARKKNLEKEKERERLRNENSVARSNELLGGIHEFARRTADALD